MARSEKDEALVRRVLDRMERDDLSPEEAADEIGMTGQGVRNYFDDSWTYLQGRTRRKFEAWLGKKEGPSDTEEPPDVPDESEAVRMLRAMRTLLDPYPPLPDDEGHALLDRRFRENGDE